MIYDLRKSYDDVFYVSGGVYTFGTITFSSILVIKHFRSGFGISEYDDLDEDAVMDSDKKLDSSENLNSNEFKNYKSTFQSLRESISKTSLVVDEAEHPE